MARLTKRVVDAAPPQGRDYFLWDEQLPCFGCRVFASGKRSYLVQYRKKGRTRRVTIALHGELTAEEARREARALLGKERHPARRSISARRIPFTGWVR